MDVRIRDVAELEAEIARLNRIVEVLMDRAERSANVQVSDFGLFQTTALLEELVGSRTAALEEALRHNERITRELRESEARFHGVLDQSLVGIGVIEDGRFGYVNGKLAAIFGKAPAALLGVAAGTLVTETDRARFEAVIAGDADGPGASFGGLRQDGAELLVELAASRMEVGGRTLVVAVIHDVTARKRAEAAVLQLQDQLRDQAIHDPLTGLYNRRFLADALERECERARRAGQGLAVIMTDIDHFKKVNDSFGHAVGDEVLCAFAELLHRHCRASDIVCRYGGEEFLLLLPAMRTAEACARAEALRLALAARPLATAAGACTLTASFGVAALPDHADDPAMLVNAADAALYAAKHGGAIR